jgi:hypothetical protein
MLSNGHHLPSDIYHVNTIASHVFPLIGGLIISFTLMGQAQHSKKSLVWVNYEWDTLSKTLFIQEFFCMMNDKHLVDGSQAARYLFKHKLAEFLPPANADIHGAETEAHVVGSFVTIQPPKTPMTNLLVAGTNSLLSESLNMYTNSVCFIVIEGVNTLNHVLHRQTNFSKEELVLANSFADDQIHLSLYGVCHNSFFTFTDISILASFINISPQYPGTFDPVVLVGYQFTLIIELNPYWLSDERGMNTISQNKERIVDILGYLGMYSLSIHESNYLAFGSQTYAFRSGRMIPIPLIERIVAASDRFSCLCWSTLAIFLVMNHLEKLREYSLFLRAANMVILEAIEMEESLAQRISEEFFKYLMLMFDSTVVPCEEMLIGFLLPLFDSLVLPKRKGMKIYAMRFFVYRNDWLATTLVEIFMQLWNTVIESLGVKIGFDFGMMSLHTFVQLDPGELNLLIAATKTTCDYCWSWSGLLNFHELLLNFVFDRGKILMDTNFNLEDKVVLKGWVLLGT